MHRSSTPSGAGTICSESAHERVADVADASPQIGDASQRAARFLALASLVAVLLCAVAIAMSARSYVRRHLDVVALMKTLGASRGLVLAVSLWQLLMLAAVASALGAAAGWLTQLWLVRVLQGLLRSRPAAGRAVARAGRLRGRARRCWRALRCLRCCS